MAPQHPLIETGARPQFLIGKREQAVVASIRAAEVPVRRLAGPGNDATGAGLMTRAFGLSGRLTGPSAVKGESRKGPGHCSLARMRYLATRLVTARWTTTMCQRRPKRRRQRAFSCESSIASRIIYGAVA